MLGVDCGGVRVDAAGASILGLGRALFHWVQLGRDSFIQQLQFQTTVMITKQKPKVFRVLILNKLFDAMEFPLSILLFINCFILYLLMFQYTSIKLPSHRVPHKHKTQTVFYSSRVSLMSPIYRKKRSNPKDQYYSSPKKKQQVSQMLAQKVSAAAFHINLTATHEDENNSTENEENKNNGKTKSKISYDSKLMKDSLALLSGTDELRREINKVGRKKNPVHKMLSDYKMVVEQGEKQKKKRNSRLHGNLKAYTQQNSLQGEKVNIQEETHRRKIINLMNSDNACHLGCVKEAIKLQQNKQTFYKVNDLKYEGKEIVPAVEFSNKNKWRVSQGAQSTHYRKKKNYRHHSEDKSFASIIIRDQSIIKRLSHIKKEVQLIRSGKMEGNTLFTSKNFMNVSMRGQKKEIIEIEIDDEGEKKDGRQDKIASFEEERVAVGSPKASCIKYKGKSKSFRVGFKNPEQLDIVVEGWKLDEVDHFEEDNFQKGSLLI